MTLSTKTFFLLALVALTSYDVEGRTVAKPTKTKPAAKPAPKPSPKPVKVTYNTPYPSACTLNITSVELLCSGTIVDGNYVATAAHCVDRATASDIIIFCDGSDKEIYASGIVIHEEWISVATLPYDIALIKLAKTTELPAVPLMRNVSKIPEGELFTLESDNEKLEVQTKREAEYVEQGVCNSTIYWTRSLAYSQICALTPSGCVSDAGAALFFTSESTTAPVFAGIASFETRSCKRHEFPLVYTSIPALAHWIDAVIAGNITAKPDPKASDHEADLISNVTETYSGVTNATVILEAAKKAISTDDSLTLSVLLDLGLSPNAEVDAYGRTLFHFAAESDAYMCAKVLVSYGANIGILEDISAATPLHFAASNGSLAVAKVLLEAGAIVNVVDNEHRTPLFYVLITGTGKLTMLKFLLDSGANPHETDNAGATPLHLAASANWISATQVLIKNGANLIVFADDGGSPLHWAAAAGANDTAVILIEAGARVNAKPKFGLKEAALSYAVRNGAPLLTVKVISSAFLIMAMIRSGSQVLVEFGGADVNDRDVKKMTPLHRAAQNGDAIVIKYLLKKGADPTARNKYGKTPVQVFCMNFNCKKEKNRAVRAMLAP